MLVSPGGDGNTAQWQPCSNTYDPAQRRPQALKNKRRNKGSQPATTSGKTASDPTTNTYSGCERHERHSPLCACCQRITSDKKKMRTKHSAEKSRESVKAKTVLSTVDATQQQTGSKQRIHLQKQAERARSTSQKAGIGITSAAMAVAASGVALGAHGEKMRSPVARKHGHPGSSSSRINTHPCG